MLNFKTVSWGIAYRKKDTENQDFIVIKNPIWGWAADPFLFKYNGQMYLFAELWDYRKGKAGLGYTIISQKKPNWKMVIKESYHLSYPNIMKINDQIYICPESCNDLSVYFYKAISFPDKWEKMEPFIKNKDYSDTTFLNIDGFLYGFACRWHEQPYKMDLFRMKNGIVEYSSLNPIIEGGMFARSGGNFIKKDGKIIKVSQDCSDYYGKSLVFSELNLHWPDFDENIIKKIDITDIHLNKNIKPIGIHTYNQCEEYEVVDFKMKNFNIINFIMRIILRLRKKIK